MQKNTKILFMLLWVEFYDFVLFAFFWIFLLRYSFRKMMPFGCR
ncbi:hypothetical protein JJD26997_0807 [Campylobacter jejuni subsp. doylei 269.97]|uniref:Uncharacterized protein n=1 Tax=Campylobacter jejuni subsp. doylei (strain ATCC BAA-1458 / RM4099 / 269.97) TaxID=360109 RepID=A7H356_CAMJD|nr:hypothetical protein JJD26997_0807 [Campylobacter jejuni subsp. doylei 269.97]